jgi:hypothetical protein
MPVPANIAALSTTAGSNSPPGSEAVTTVDDYLRAHAAFIAQLRDRPTAYALTLLDDADAAAARATLGATTVGGNVFTAADAAAARTAIGAASSSNVVTLDTNQNIGGLKTFDTGMVSNSLVNPIGYASAVHNTVTQTTDKSTAVTINNPVGTIVLHNQTISPGASFLFTVNNSLVTLNDVIILSGGGSTFYFDVTTVGSGLFQVRGVNYTSFAVTNSPRLNFAIIRGEA